MTSGKRHIVLILGALVSVATIGCYSVSYGAGGYERHGVWLPRKGEAPYQPDRRIEIRDLVMHFDDELRVYLIDDMPNHFYSVNTYYRLTGEQWETARTIEGPWLAAEPSQLPPSLIQGVPRS